MGSSKIDQHRYMWPGYAALFYLVLTTSLWTFWGAAEMYYEGWGLPFPVPLVYLVPGGICLLLTLAALAWPRFGGWLLILVGGGFSLWWGRLAISRGGFSLQWVLATFPVSGLLVLTGALLLVDGQRRARLLAAGRTPPPGWLARNWRFVAALGAPLIVLIAVSASSLPGVPAREDDGDRGARWIEGHGVTLIWAPAGPGWNWQQPNGDYPSWESLAAYGVPPVGLGEKDGLAGRAAVGVTNLCVYLTADGLALAEEPQYVWRMPTADELLRSLSRRGENAGCAWQGEPGRAHCTLTPDKETPLWAPDQPPIYYWAADEAGPTEAWYVSYNGAVRSQPRDWGNPRHGYRCVREP